MEERRRRALSGVVALSEDEAGRRRLCEWPGAAAALAALAEDPRVAVAKEALRALVNLASEPAAGPALRPHLPALLRLALRRERRADPRRALAAAALAKLSRQAADSAHLWDALRRHDGGLHALMERLCAPRPRLALAPLLANLTQLARVRALLLRRRRSIYLRRLLDVSLDPAPPLWRGGLVGALRNCCFDLRSHDWLLSNEINLLPYLLLPLTGPEELPYYEMGKLPMEVWCMVQPGKQREPDPDIRKMLLEALLLLTATTPGRHLLRERGTYFILRELHKAEADPGVLAACEKVIQVLISDEPEPGMENLLEVEIPAEGEEELRRLDREEEEEEDERDMHEMQINGPGAPGG